MILYASPMSPYSARVRYSLYHKDIAFEQIKPSQLGGMKAPAFLAVAPLGKIPVLELDDGNRIAESDCIVEFLEDRYPERSLRPADDLLLARARSVARIADLYVMGGLFTTGLTTMMPLSLHLPQKVLDQELIDSGSAVLVRAMESMQQYMDPSGPFAMGSQPTIADGALVPYLVFVEAAAQQFGRSALLGERQLLADYLDRVSERDPMLARVRRETVEAMVERREEIRAKAAA